MNVTADKIDYKTTFAEADALLTSLARLREQIAALLAKPTPAVEQMYAAVDDLLGMQASVDDAVALIAPHENALHGIERDLILENDDAAIGKLEAKLKSLSGNRDRIAILQGEMSDRVQAMRKAIADEGARKFAVKKRAEIEALLEQLKIAPNLVADFEAVLNAKEKADSILTYMRSEHRKYPDVPEADFPSFGDELDAPQKLFKAFARKYMNLVQQKSDGPLNIPGVGILMPNGTML